MRHLQFKIFWIVYLLFTVSLVWPNKVQTGTFFNSYQSLHSCLINTSVECEKLSESIPVEEDMGQGLRGLTQIHMNLDQDQSVEFGDQSIQSQAGSFDVMFFAKSFDGGFWGLQLFQFFPKYSLEDKTTDVIVEQTLHSEARLAFGQDVIHHLELPWHLYLKTFIPIANSRGTWNLGTSVLYNQRFRWSFDYDHVVQRIDLQSLSTTEEFVSKKRGLINRYTTALTWQVSPMWTLDGFYSYKQMDKFPSSNSLVEFGEGVEAGLEHTFTYRRLKAQTYLERTQNRSHLAQEFDSELAFKTLSHWGRDIGRLGLDFAWTKNFFTGIQWQVGELYPLGNRLEFWAPNKLPESGIWSQLRTVNPSSLVSDWQVKWTKWRLQSEFQYNDFRWKPFIDLYTLKEKGSLGVLDLGGFKDPVKSSSWTEHSIYTPGIQMNYVGAFSEYVMEFSMPWETSLMKFQSQDSQLQFGNSSHFLLSMKVWF